MMKNLRLIIFIIIVITLAALWGYFQPTLFPQEKYGYLYIVTSSIGGFSIGSILATLYISLEDLEDYD